MLTCRSIPSEGSPVFRTELTQNSDTNRVPVVIKYSITNLEAYLIARVKGAPVCLPAEDILLDTGSRNAARAAGH